MLDCNVVFNTICSDSMTEPPRVTGNMGLLAAALFPGRTRQESQDEHIIIFIKRGNYHDITHQTKTIKHPKKKPDYKARKAQLGENINFLM